MELDLTQGLSAIVLAAGANTRLAGITAPFTKPLLTVNGRTLFDHALAEADRWDADEIVAVVSPHNAYQLRSSVVGAYVTQAKPTGFLDAVRLALPFVNKPTTLILCADNLFEGAVPASNLACFGARDDVPPAAATRFTRYYTLNNVLYFRNDRTPGGLSNGCWIGPVRCSTDVLRRSLATGPTLEALLRDLDLRPVPMRCVDLGVPEEVL
jgi:MobA-like NTP transferase protein